MPKKMNMTIVGSLGERVEHKRRMKDADPKSIAAKRPDLMEFWDWEKNAEAGNDPYAMHASSCKQSWWKCKDCGNSFHVRTNNLTYNNQGCPICAGRQVCKGYNDFASNCPEMAAEWDYSLNAKGPDEYTCGSHYRAHWICAVHGVKWETEIKVRASLGTGCPECRRERISRNAAKPKRGGTYLSEGYPDVAAEWCYELNGDVTPDTVPSGTSKAYWWECSECGHRWVSTVCNRTGSRLNGCPECARKRVGMLNARPKPKRSIAELHPELAKEWHPTKNGNRRPDNVAYMSNKDAWWLCQVCGYEYQATPSNRAHAKFGCPKCLNEHRSAVKATPKPGESLGEMYPEIAREWHPTKNGDVTPYDVAKRSNINRWWVCSDCGFEWEAAPCNRVGERSGCPRCNCGNGTSFPEKALAYYLSMAFPDLQENAHPEIEGLGDMELDIWIPSMDAAVEYDGERWHTDVERDVRKNAACSESGITIIRVREPNCPQIPDDTSLNIVRSDVRSYASLEDAISRCLYVLDDEMILDINLERDRQDIYALTRTYSYENSIEQLYPEVAAQWHPTKNGDLKPSMFTPGSAYKAWWICPTCGKSYATRIAHRCNGHGCKSCASKRAWEKRKLPSGSQMSLELTL